MVPEFRAMVLGPEDPPTLVLLVPEKCGPAYPTLSLATHASMLMHAYVHVQHYNAVILHVAVLLIHNCCKFSSSLAMATSSFQSRSPKAKRQSLC